MSVDPRPAPRVLAGRYRLLDRVAAGAMGEVWRAHDDRLDRVVAVKVLRPELAEDADFVDRFRVEARHAASVRHPHVAAVHDYGEDAAVRTGGAATAYLVMDLLDGDSLATVLAEQGPLAEGRVAALLAQVADALAAAHGTGLVHRDVKPANLVLARGRTPETVTVTDFGIARAADAVPVTRTGLVMGTAEYLSPEQAQGGRATPASDVYSLGVVAQELLTGAPPFTAAAPAEVARAHVQDAPPPLPAHVSPAMRATVARCLVKDAARRPDAAALAARLRSVAGGTAAATDGWLPDAPDRDTDLAAATPDLPPAPTPATPPPAAPAATPTATPATREIPVVGGGDPPGARAAEPARSPRPTGRRRFRSPLRAPVVALLALLALLLLASALQQAGLLGGVGSAAGGVTSSVTGGGDAIGGAAHDVTGSPGTTIDEDGR